MRRCPKPIGCTLNLTEFAFQLGATPARPNGSAKMDMHEPHMGEMATGGMEHAHEAETRHVLRPPLAAMTALSFLVLAAGLGVAVVFGGLSDRRRRHVRGVAYARVSRGIAST